MGQQSFLFLGANSPWTYGLAEALAQHHYVHAVEFYDWRTYNHIRPTWCSHTPPALMQRTFKVLPTGYAGKLEKVFRFYLQFLIQKWCHQLQEISGEKPWVIACHPYLTYWVRQVPATQLIYYNFDDYVLYRPNREQQILAQEQELIERAAITLCASYSQFIALGKRHPQRLPHIRHYPHGFVNNYLNPQSQVAVEKNTVGYVGNLGDRLDWQLIYQVITACPKTTFIFVGGRDNQGTFNSQDWQQTREAVLSLPNVRHIGRVPPTEVATYYCSFAITWIPYLVNHKFNQASCPTKIMDGIASSRPILSTDIPECRLYRDWISIFHSSEDAIVSIHKQLGLLHTPEACIKSFKQLEFARQNTWQKRAQLLESWLSKPSYDLLSPPHKLTTNNPKSTI